MKIKDEITVKIDTLDEQGYGVATYGDKKVKVLDALPGEDIRVQLYKKEKGSFLGQKLEILKPATFRLPSLEEHFLSCSCWQIMPVDKENDFKKLQIHEHFRTLASTDLGNFDILSDENEYHYRNKAEFSFYANSD